MNYPVWDLHVTGGGFWIALVAVTHVFVSHFAVGGGLWLVVTEHRARRADDARLLDYVKGQSRFFLLLTMVFGGLSGVGIWWTIALLNPAATSVLIHTFVFGWATEWVCFVAEIVALFIYYSTFDRMRAREHLVLGWFYFAFAWLSLFLINGIIGFMLTPGGWLRDGSFWSGFFNPVFWPSLVFRTCLALAIAGMFGLLTATGGRDDAFRRRTVRWSASWILAAFLPMLASGWWYLHALAPGQQAMIVARATETARYLRGFLVLSPVLVLLTLVLLLRLPRLASRPLAWTLLAVGFLHLASFEFLREAGRRPWVISGHMYATGIPAADADALNAGGILAAARWSPIRAVTPENRLAAGAEIFSLECACCHSIGGPLNDILPLAAGMSRQGLDAVLSGQGTTVAAMPPFLGTAAERGALADYLAGGLPGHRAPTSPPPPATIPPRPSPEPLPFDDEKDDYVLLAWNNLGMHCTSDADRWLVILPPANDLRAQLIRRGDVPEIVTQDVELTYAIDPAFAHPEDHVPFWEYVAKTFGVELKPGVGLSGNRVEGTLAVDPQGGVFRGEMIPVVPYTAAGFDPYPLVTVEARDKASGAVLARTRAVLPVSTEIGCRKCHGGEWRIDGLTGFSDATARSVLAAHDRHAGTRLVAEAESGRPRLCQSCHADPILGADGDPRLLNMSAAVHGWHANYLRGRGAEACAFCHPADPAGATACLRGNHAGKVDCTRCHGTIEDHALGLLKAESAAGKAAATRLMAHLAPRSVASVDEVVGRTPWLQEPDCLGCHVDYARPDPATASAYNRWTAGQADLFRVRHDDSGLIPCEACHGPTHALYPALDNRYGRDLDNLQPLRYQGNRRPLGAGGGCRVCHRTDMTDAVHHANIPDAGS